MGNRLRSSLTDFSNSLEKSPTKISGRLGIPLGGQILVEVPGRNSFVYVRLRNNQNEVIQAFNNQVSPSYDLPVLVVREGNRYIIEGVDTQRYGSNWPTFSPYLPRHGNTHSFTDDGSGGGDVAWVYGRQFMPMLTMPSGSSGGPGAFIGPYLLRDLNGGWKYVGNTGTPDLTKYNPTGSYGVMVLIYIDASTGNPGFIVNSGSYFPATKTGTPDLVPYLPTLSTNPNLIPDSAIRLVSGTLVIGWNNIYDARQYFNMVPTGTAGGSVPGGAGAFGVFGEIQGIPLGTGTIFNVNGSRLTLTISGSTLQLSNSPDPQEFIGMYGENQGIPLGTGSVLNVVGSRLILTISGTNLQLSNSPEPIDNIGVFVQDEGVPLGTGSVLNFVGPNVSVSVSGTVARVFITGSTGGGIPSGTIQIFNSGTFLGSMDKLNFQYPLAAGFTGTMGYAYLNGFLLAWEDVSAQITGSNAHFTLTGTIAQGTDRLYYNGLRQQRITHYTVDANGQGFQTLFTGSFGDVLIMEYGNAGATPQTPGAINIYDDGNLKGSATKGISFDTGLDAYVDINGLAHISGSLGGGGGGSGGAPTGAFYLLGKSESALPSGVVISGLLASPDKDGAPGLDLEFTSTADASQFVWSTAPSVVNSHSDYMSHLHVVYSGTSPTSTRGMATYVITGAFDIRTKLSFGNKGSGTPSAYFHVANASGTYGAYILVEVNLNSHIKDAQPNIGTGTWVSLTEYTTNFPSGPIWSIGFPSGPIYLRITKEVPDWIRHYISTDGLTWLQIGERKMGGLAVGRIGFELLNGAGYPSSSAELLVDWLRSNV